MRPEDNVCDRIERLLAYESAVLRNGGYAELGPLADEKERLTDSLATAADARTAARIERIRTLANRNLRLIASALAGIAAARRHGEELSRAASQLATYDRLGKPLVITEPAGRIERKA